MGGEVQGSVAVLGWGWGERVSDRPIAEVTAQSHKGSSQKEPSWSPTSAAHSEYWGRGGGGGRGGISQVTGKA